MATATEVSSELRRLWALVLRVDESAIDDDANFFDLGGTSLAALQVGSLLFETYQVEVGVMELFELTDLGPLARHVASLTNDG